MESKRELLIDFLKFLDNNYDIVYYDEDEDYDGNITLDTRHYDWDDLVTSVDVYLKAEIDTYLEAEGNNEEDS